MKKQKDLTSKITLTLMLEEDIDDCEREVTIKNGELIGALGSTGALVDGTCYRDGIKGIYEKACNFVDAKCKIYTVEDEECKYHTQDDSDCDFYNAELGLEIDNDELLEDEPSYMIINWVSNS